MVRQRDGVSFGHPPEDGRVDVVWAVSRAEDEYPVGAGHQAVPMSASESVKDQENLIRD